MTRPVLFDLDGTLLDTAPDFTIILNQALEKHGKPLLAPQIIRDTVSDGAGALIRRGFNITENDPGFQTLLEELLELYEQQLRQSQSLLFNGMAALLRAIEARGDVWGIVTNKPSRFAVPLTESFPALANCSVLICPEHVSKRKPDPEGLLLACSKLGLKPRQGIYVGDHLRDIEAGRNAGMTTLAASWGYFPLDTDLHSWQADRIIDQPADILSILNQ